MQRISTLSDGQTIMRLTVRKDVENRLKTTCFRGKDQRLAGNFTLWTSFEEMLDDQAFRRCFLPELEMAIRRREKTGMPERNERMCIRCEKIVGWTSTIDAKLVTDHETEEFRLNKHAQAKRLTNVHVEAPQTRLVTLALGIKKELCGWDIIVHKIFPGRDVGAFNGDVSTRNGVVFYQRENPGSLNPKYIFD